ncbi:MAG: Gfo/Idh/MocA family oxidoreductase [Planctomycetota bacterium]
MTHRGPVKFGVVGTGGMAGAHARAMAEIPGVKLEACADVDGGRAETFAAEHGFAQHTTDNARVFEGCDAVSIVTPDRFHAELTLAALRAGAHVLCEKPLTVTLAEARKVSKAAQLASQRGQVHMINFSYRNSAAFHKAQQLVASGKLGQVRHVYGRYLQAWLATDVWGPWTRPQWLWRLQTSAGSGGVLGDVGCHILDFITGIAGDVDALRCSLSTHAKRAKGEADGVTEHGWKKLDANDTATIELSFTDGGDGVAHATRWAGGLANSVGLMVFGTEGSLAIDLDEGYHRLRVLTGKARHSASKIGDWKVLDLKPTPSIYKRFVKSIKTGDNDQPDLLRGAQVQAYLDACERSAADGGSKKKVLKWC